MQAVEGIYHNGQIKLLEKPKKISRSRVIVTFLDGEREERQSLANMGEILDEDLESASLEIRQQFLEAIEKSGEEVQK